MRVLSIMMIDEANFVRPTEEQQQKMGALIADWRNSGVLIDTGGAMDGMMELKIVRSNGKTSITDGPFTESKEVVGGYALLEVKDRDDAIAWTNRFLDVIGNGVTCYVHEVSVV